MYPLGKMMQLKLNLFEESLDKYRRGKGFNQKLLRTGKPKGTFKRGEPHPTVEGLFYFGYRNGIESWVELESIKRHQARMSKYNQKEEVKEKARVAQRKYRNTDAYKEWIVEYNKSEKRKETLRKYQSSEKGKKVRDHFKKNNKDKIKKYRVEYKKSDKGKKSAARYRKTEGYKKSLKKYVENNKDKIKKYWAEYRQSDEGRAKRDAYRAKRRAVKAELIKNLNKEEEIIIKHFFDYRIRLQNKLGIDFHVDHIVPLSKGGLHHPMNLQVVPAKWNLIKGNFNTEKWLPNGL